VQFWFRIDRVIVEKDVLAQKWAIHDSNDFFFFFFFCILKNEISYSSYFVLNFSQFPRDLIFLEKRII
jgi:hypothetical protein